MIGDPFGFAIGWGDAQVSYDGTTVSIEQAHDNGWVMKFLSSYDPGISGYIMETAPDGQLDHWRGFWVKALVECDLIIPNTPMP